MEKYQPSNFVMLVQPKKHNLSPTSVIF